MKTKDRIPYEIKDHRLPVLLRRFEQDYGADYVRLADQLKKAYPDICRKGRRTARALRNICFFVWCYARYDDKPLIPTLFNASVLLSAQDDYYDNPRIPHRQKDAFCSATNSFIGTGSLPSASGQSRQTQELIALWSRIAKPIQAAPPAVQSYWEEKARQLNDAMATENRAARRTNLAFDQYLRTAVHSIGMVFVWSTYLVHKGMPPSTLRDMDPILLQGAKIARLSNDIASYRQRKNRMNAVILLGGGPAAARRVRRLMTQECDLFRSQIDALLVERDVKRAILRSTEFLTAFYQRSDFDKRPLR